VIGDYGTKHSGEVFDVPPHQVRRLLHLEARGIIERYRPPVDRKAYTVKVYDYKMLTKRETKGDQ
jgi:DNA-binding Lrp family transcriptional regulator